MTLMNNAINFEPKPASSKLKAVIVVTAIVLVVGLVAAGWWLHNWYEQNLQAPAQAPNTAALVRIQPGTGSGQIAKNLQSYGVIRNQLAFRWYLFRHGLSTQIQAGLYRLEGDLSAHQVADIVTSGKTAAISITITPGLRLDQIKDLLVDRGYALADINKALTKSYSQSILADKPSGASLEGYLMPDTYRVEIDQPVSELVDLMLTNADQKLTADIRDGWRKRGLNLHQGLTLSSIIQKEEDANYEVQQQVAQVFLKRLHIGMKLESDITFEYAAAVLRQTASINLNSPYNTYQHKGLPPTPIATIGLSAARAVGNPATTDWLYFLADKHGVTHFSRTEAEHKQNIEKYLR